MSDLLAPSTLDASSADDNLRAIRHVESSWRLPALPDEARLDLSTMGVHHTQLSKFLFQLDKDLNNENPEDLAGATLTPTDPLAGIQIQPTPGTAYSPIARDAFSKTLDVVTSLRGLKVPQVLDDNSVQRWKLDAIKKGYMEAPQDGVVDNTWSLDMAGIKNQMVYDELDARYRGYDRPGAQGFGKVVETIGEWTSPSGLLRAATKLDLWWDTGAVGKEFSSWGQKWEKVGKSKNPLDFAKNLVDAVTGPLDDIAVPVLNWALLVSGVGAATNFARVGFLGAEAAVGSAEAASALYRVPKFASFVERIFPAVDAAKVADLGEASWTAQKLMGSGSKAANAVGSALADWRGLRGVTATKGIVQTGMKLGIAQMAEDKLLPSYQGGAGLDSLPGVNEAANYAFSDSHGMAGDLARSVGEIAFAPFTIFEPGTFVNGGKAAVQQAFRFLGTTPGRAAAGAVAGAGYAAVTDGNAAQDAAIGAGVAAIAPGAGRLLKTVGQTTKKFQPFGDETLVSKLVNTTGTLLAGMSWKPLAANQNTTQVFADAMRLHLAPGEWSKFEQIMSKQGFLKTYADFHGVDEEAASAAMGYLLSSAAIDVNAATMAGNLDRSSTAWRQRHLLGRNKLNAQIRVFKDEDANGIAWAIANKEGLSRKDVLKRFRELRDTVNEHPETVAELIAHHNDQARMTLGNLFSEENIPLSGMGDAIGQQRRAEIVKYLADAMPTFGNWTTYQPLTAGLRGHIESGLFEGMRLKAAKKFGSKGTINLVPHLEQWSPDPSIADMQQQMAKMTDSLIGSDGRTVTQLRDQGWHMNPLAQEIDPTTSRITLAHVDTPTKQEYLEAASELRATLNIVGDFATVGHLDDAAGLLVERLGSMSRYDVEETIKAMTARDAATKSAFSMAGKEGPVKLTDARRKSLQRAHDFVEHMKSQGVDVGSNLERALDSYAQQLARDARWGRYKQSATVIDKESKKVLTGMSALKVRMKELQKEARFAAAEADVDHLVASVAEAKGQAAADDLKAYLDHANSQGYKVVYGADFLMPEDLLHRTGVFEDINTRHLNAMTIGNFFGKQQPEQMAAYVQRARKRGIARELGKVLGEDIHPQDERVDDVIRSLYELVLDPEMARNKQLIDDLAHQSIAQRTGTAIWTGLQARSIQDLGAGIHRKRVVSAMMDIGYSEKEAAAIWQGVKAGRYAEFQGLGLASIEAKLRGRSQFLDALNVLGVSKDASRLRTAAKTAATGAAAGAVYGAVADDQSVLDGAIAGAGVGAAAGLARVVASPATRAIADKMDYTSWARYGYLADNLAAVRDRMRFTLSPFFDISRYTEAFMLGQVGAPKRLEDGTRLALPLNQSPKALRRRLTKQAEEMLADGRLAQVEPTKWADSQMRQIHTEMLEASRGRFDPGELESTARWFTEIGMAGFNPTAYMSSTFHYLRQSGMKPEKAWEAVKDMYTYGTHGRSAFEQSVNFVFFPFSFQKKTVGHMADWLADDVSRAIILHDSYKAYQALDERYDLGKWADQHLPLLRQLQRLNMLGYGMSPGRLGGINAPFVDALVGDPTSADPDRRGLILNLFSPVGVNVGKEGVASKELLKLTKKLVPLVNDLKFMLADLDETKHVVFDDAHITRKWQARQGNQEWAEYKKGVDGALKSVGASWDQMRTDPGLAALNDEFNAKKHDLEKRYPGWVEAKLNGMGNKAELDQEKAFALEAVREGEGDATQVQFAQFEQMLAEMKSVYGQYGITDFEDMPPDGFAQVQGVAREMIRLNPAFASIYRRFYSRQFGDVYSEVF